MRNFFGSQNDLTFDNSGFGSTGVLTNANQSADRSWIATSNNYTNLLIQVEFKRRPERAST